MTQVVPVVCGVQKMMTKKMTDLEQVLTYYGCDRWCFVNHDCKNCFWKQYVEFQLEKLRAEHFLKKVW